MPALHPQCQNNGDNIPQQRISIVNALEFLNWYADKWLIASDLETDELVGQLSETERARIRRAMDIAEDNNK